MTIHGPIYRMVEERKKELHKERRWLEQDYQEQGLGEIGKETEMVFSTSIATINELLPKIQSLEPVWISVGEQLPELSEEGGSPTVLTCDTEWQVHENCYFYGDELEDGEWSENDVEIIAWMPLPLPPNE